MSEQMVWERRAGFPDAPPAPVRSWKSIGKSAGLAALVIAAGFAGAAYVENWWKVGRFIETTDDAYVGGDVTQIAPHIPGFVREIRVGDHQFVRAGDTLVRLDPDDFQAALSHAEATLESRKATLASLRARRDLQSSNINAANADVAAKEAQAVFALKDAERYHALAQTVAGSRQNEQRTEAADKSARAAVQGAKAALGAARQQVDVLEAQIAAAVSDVRQAEADLKTARLNLGYTDVVAPVSGYVGNRSAQIGAYVATGTNLLSVVPARGLWVDANFKEDQLATMKPGAPATVVADVLPGRTFHGHVASLAPATGAVFSVIPPQNATGNFTKIVQRVPVRIVFDDDGQDLGLLRAGLSVTARIDTRKAGE